MNATFDTMAEFDKQSEDKKESAVPENTAQVDFSSIVGRLNSLQTMVEKIQREISERQSENVPRGALDENSENVPRGTLDENSENVQRGTSEESALS